MSWDVMLNQLLDRATNLKFKDEAELDDITKIISLYSEKLFSNASKYGNLANKIMFYTSSLPITFDYEKSLWESGRKELCNVINTMIKDYELSDIHNTNVDKNKTCANSKNIFVVHGHDENLKLKVSYWLFALD